MACKSYLFYVSFKTLKGYCLKYAKHFIIYDVNIQWCQCWHRCYDVNIGYYFNFF